MGAWESAEAGTGQGKGSLKMKMTVAGAAGRLWELRSRVTAWKRVEGTAEHVALRGSERNGLVRMTTREEEWCGRKAMPRWKEWERGKCPRKGRDSAWA